MRQARNVYWNAFKHATDRAGESREDEELLGAFSDQFNELMLFIGWFDYMNTSAPLPIEVQVFQVWMWAKRIESLSEAHDRDFYANMFPRLAYCLVWSRSPP